MPDDTRFTARVIRGSGRGKRLGVPTLNLDLACVPIGFAHGIYACRAIVLREKRKMKNAKQYSGALHYGPRPVFDDAVSCEVHLIDAKLPIPPQNVTIDIVARIRNVRTFPSADALTRQMNVDIDHIRDILSRSEDSEL